MLPTELKDELKQAVENEIDDYVIRFDGDVDLVTEELIPDIMAQVDVPDELVNEAEEMLSVLICWHMTGSVD